MAEKNEARLLAEEAELFTRLSADFRTRPEETTVVGTFQFVPQQSIEVRLQNLRLFGEQTRFIFSAKTAC